MRAPSWKVRSLVVVGLLALVASGCAFTQRVSVDSAGQQASNFSVNGSISADGRYVAFETLNSMVAGDTNGAYDIYVRDTASGTTTRVSVTNGGAQGNADSLHASISANGRYVVFYSLASNLVTGDTNNQSDIFVRDIPAGTTTRVSVASAGTQGNLSSYDPEISADGRAVTFYSYASNLIAGDTNNAADVFVRDTVAGATTRVSVASGGTQANDFSEFEAISTNGRYIAFSSHATNLVVGDTNATDDVFLRDTVAGTTTRVSVDGAGNEANGRSFTTPTISGDGRYVAFDSDATNLAAGDTNGLRDVFVRDTTAGTTTRVSVDSGGNQITQDSSGGSISADGRYVAFVVSTDSGSTHEPGLADIFVRDTVGGTTTPVSLDTTGHSANGPSYDPAISGDGRYVAFTSEATNLVAGDTNNNDDVFVRANPQPTVTSMAPSALVHGASTPVTITGSGFITGAIVVVDGPGTSVSTVTVVSPTTITATVNVDVGAALTTRNVWVELPGTGPGVSAGAMGVCAGCASVT